MQALLDVIIPVFVVIGAGYVAVWRGLFTNASVDGLMAFTQNFAIPCLLFRALWTLDLGDSFHPALLISFYTGSATGFLRASLRGATSSSGTGKMRWPSASAASSRTPS